METPHGDEELLAYRVIELSLLPSQLLLADTEEYSGIFLSFTDGKVHEAVELRGEGDLFSSIFFFLWLRRTTPEVCYRSKIGESGTVIFSVYDKDEKLRPVWIRESKELSGEKKNKMEILAKRVFFDDGKINILLVWQEVEKNFSEVSILAFVEFLDVLMRDQEKVHLEGTIPLAPALALINYLVATRKTVVWNGKKIQ